MQVKKKRNLIFANVFLLLVLAAGATYAWFALNTTASVTISEVTVSGPGELEMRISDESDWKNYLLLSEANDFTNLKMVDVSGKGNGIFYRPNSVGNTGSPASDATWLNVSTDITTDTSVDNIDAVDHNGANKDYMKIDLQLRASSKETNLSSIDVYLKEGSKLSTVAPTDKLNGTNAENKSTFGDFSKDYVIGGIRVSAIDSNTKIDSDNSDSNITTNEPDPLFVWIPRPDIELVVDGSEGSKTYTILTNGTDKTHKYVTSIDNKKDGKEGNPKYTTGDFASDKTITEQIKSDTEKKLVSLTKDGNYYTGKVTLYVWLEGCDTEARRALVGGRFRLQLLLDTKEVSQTS